MSDDEPCFDDWESALNAVSEAPSESLPSTHSPASSPSKQQQPEQSPSQKEIKISAETLESKLKRLRSITPQEFLAANSESNTKDKALNLSWNSVMKNDKDFAIFGKVVAKNICEFIEEGKTWGDEPATKFFEHLLLCFYDRLDYKNMNELISKIKIFKRDRKKEEKELQKKREKKENKVTKAESETPEPETQKDDLFGGVAMTNSKEVEEELKKAPPITRTRPVQDDDFW